VVSSNEPFRAAVTEALTEEGCAAEAHAAGPKAIEAAKTRPPEVIFVGPPTLLPRSFEQLGAKVTHNFDDVIGQVDVINMLRVQFERIKSSQFPSVREFTRLFGLTWDRFQRCKKDVFVMHPGPMNRGIEISSDIADGPQSGILTQVTNGLAIRMAVLYLVSLAT